MDFLWAHVCAPLAGGSLPIVLAMLLAGLGGSMTHCLTMCSSFVLGQTPAGSSWLGRLLLPYHLGRVTTYGLLGGVSAAGLAFIPQSAFLTVARHFVLAAAAAIFIWIFAERLLSRLGLRLPFRIPVAGCVLSGWRRLQVARGPVQRFGLGLSLGLLPCPLVMAAVMAAATTRSATAGALAMLCFGLGTAPGLMALSFAKANLLKASPRTQDALSMAALGINGIILLAMAAG